jgi:hypothetical protein
MTDAVILRASTSRQLTSSTIFAFPLIYWGLGFFGDPKDRMEMLVFAVSFTVACGYFVLVAACAKWRFDELGITRLTPLTRRAHVAWSDVRTIHEGSWRSLVLSGTFRKAVIVPRGLVGIEELHHFVLAHLPGTLSDHTRRVLERRFGAATAVAIPVDAPEVIEGEHEDATVRWRGNPFFVLGLSPECSRADVERSGQKLLALLAIDSGPAKRATTPFGEVDRTEGSVRAAMAELRDPEKRLSHEAWARLTFAGPVTGVAVPKGDDPTRPWEAAMIALGWRGP